MPDVVFLDPDGCAVVVAGKVSDADRRAHQHLPSDGWLVVARD